MFQSFFHFMVFGFQPQTLLFWFILTALVMFLSAAAGSCFQAESFKKNSQPAQHRTTKRFTNRWPNKQSAQVFGGTLRCLFFSIKSKTNMFFIFLWVKKADQCFIRRKSLQFLLHEADVFTEAQKHKHIHEVFMLSTQLLNALRLNIYSE